MTGLELKNGNFFYLFIISFLYSTMYYVFTFALLLPDDDFINRNWLYLHTIYTILQFLFYIYLFFCFSVYIYMHTHLPIYFKLIWKDYWAH